MTAHLRSGDNDPDKLVILGACSLHTLVQLVSKEGGDTPGGLDCRGEGGGTSSLQVSLRTEPQ